MSNSTSGHRAWWFAATVAIVLFLFFAANAGRVLVVDSLGQSDVILVLAGETDHRPALAMQLLKRGYARRVILDVPAGQQMFGFSEVDLAERYVQSLPHANAISVCPIIGLSTKDESHDAEKCLNHESEGGNRILIVTSDFHTRRALSVFQHEIPGKAFTVTGSHDDVQFRSTLVAAPAVGEDLPRRMDATHLVDHRRSLALSRLNPALNANGRELPAKSFPPKNDFPSTKVIDCQQLGGYDSSQSPK